MSATTTTRLNARREQGKTAPAPGAGRAPRTMSKGAVNAVLAIGAVYTLFPFLWLVLAAVKNTGGLMSGDVFSLHNLDPVGDVRALFHADHGIYARWYLNSVLYAGIGSAISALISIAAGYAFDKYRFRGSEKLFGLVLLGVLIPGTATALPLYLLASKLHLVNTVWAVFLPYVVNPFGVYLGRVFSAGYVPGEVMEAARLDGASELKIFRSIALPMLKPGFATVMLFQFSAIWNGFYIAYLMLSDSKLFPVSLGIYMWNYQAQTTDPEYLVPVITGSALAIVPVIVLFVSLQRFWRSGLTAGAVK